MVNIYRQMAEEFVQQYAVAKDESEIESILFHIAENDLAVIEELLKMAVENNGLNS